MKEGIGESGAGDVCACRSRRAESTVVLLSVACSQGSKEGSPCHCQQSPKTSPARGGGLPEEEPVQCERAGPGPQDSGYGEV